MTNKKDKDREIDFVITWVDSDDPEWQKELKKYDKNYNPKDPGRRYRTWNTLRYIFRGFERCTPWVRKVHFVTYGHVPKWLNINHPKINIVNHREILPKYALPTYNSGAIEMGLANIPNLAEQFVYFNDDIFLLKPCETERFFKDGLPRDFLIVVPYIKSYQDPRTQVVQSRMGHITNHTSKVKLVKKNFFKMFTFKYGIKGLGANLIWSILPTGRIPIFKGYHVPQPFLKSEYHDTLKFFNRYAEHTMRSKFRNDSYASQMFIRFWQLAQGKFCPFFPGDHFEGHYQSEHELIQHINKITTHKGYTTGCFNDNYDVEEKEAKKIESLLDEFFEAILPGKSSFEK